MHWVRKGCGRFPHSGTALGGVRWLIRFSGQTVLGCHEVRAWPGGCAHRDRTGGLGQTAVSCGATIPWRGGLGGWDIGVEACAAQLVINRRLTHGRHGRGTASEGRINRCVRPVDEAVNADESRIRQSRCVVAGAPSVHSGNSMVGR